MAVRCEEDTTQMLKGLSKLVDELGRHVAYEGTRKSEWPPPQEEEKAGGEFPEPHLRVGRESACRTFSLNSMGPGTMRSGRVLMLRRGTCG